jgi:hypothetical protein
MQITLIVTKEEVDLIGLWLSELPYKYSAKLIDNIKKQYDLHISKEVQKEIDLTTK